MDDEQRRAALATNTIAHWIPAGDERMLVSDLRAIWRRGEERLLVAVRFLNQGVSIELEDIDLEAM